MLAMQEAHFQRDWFSKPADTLVSMMQKKNLNPSDVASNITGGISTLRNLLSGSIAIDADLASELATAVGGSISFWLRRQGLYENALCRVVDTVIESGHTDWISRLPVPKSKYCAQASGDLRRSAVERRLVFFDVNGPEAWSRRYGTLRNNTRFRESDAFEVHPGATAMWLRQGELEAALISVEIWNPEGLKTAIGEILQLSRIGRPDRFLPRLRELLAMFGVALVVVKAPDGCRASGAARMLSESKGMVLVSFRYLSDDHFWFTLLHEIGHLLLHQGKVFIDEEGAAEDDAEREANMFAAGHIVPPTFQSEFMNLKADHESVIRFSRKLRIAPGIIVGQMQNRGLIQHNWLNKLRRRWTWDDIESALA